MEKLAALWIWADGVDLGMPAQSCWTRENSSFLTKAAAPSTDQTGAGLFPPEIKEAAGPLIEVLNAHLPEPQNNSR
jgi:hypothetical protein